MGHETPDLGAVLRPANACLWRGKYYCALPLDGSPINNAVLIYDSRDGTWLLREDVSAEIFLPTQDALYMTSATTPGQIWKWRENSWAVGAASAAPVRWVSPWNDLRHQHYAKGSLLSLGATDSLTAENVLSLLAQQTLGKFLVDPAYSNNITSVFYDGREWLGQIKAEVDMGRSPTYFRRGLTQAQVDEGVAQASAMIKKGGVVEDSYQSAKQLWKQYNAILDDDTLPNTQREEQARLVRQQINQTLLPANAAIADFKTQYGYAGDTAQNIDNFINLFTDEKPVATALTAQESLPRTFKEDTQEPYMQQAQAVYQITGKDSALPHPNSSFSSGKVTYTVEEADWENWCVNYKKGYAEYVAEHSAGWEDMTQEEQLEVMTGAHTAGNNAAKKWYKKLHGIK